MTDSEITKRVALANLVFNDTLCQSVAEVVHRRLQDAARSASVSSILFAAKLRADEQHGSATPTEVSDLLIATLNFLSDFVDESDKVSGYSRDRGAE